jgi:hypothetical protein
LSEREREGENGKEISSMSALFHSLRSVERSRCRKKQVEREREIQTLFLPDIQKVVLEKLVAIVQRERERERERERGREMEKQRERDKQSEIQTYFLPDIQMVALDTNSLRSLSTRKEWPPTDTRSV